MAKKMVRNVTVILDDRWIFPWFRQDNINLEVSEKCLSRIETTQEGVSNFSHYLGPYERQERVEFIYGDWCPLEDEETE